MHGRQEAISADGLFFPFRFRPMARWVFLSLRRRGPIGVQSFLQLGTRIPYGSRARTSEGDGGVCSDCSDLRVAGAVYGYHGGKVAKQRPSVAPVCSCAASDLSARTALQLRHAYCWGGRNSSRYSGVSSGAKPWRVVFSVTTRGIRNCSR